MATRGKGWRSGTRDTFQYLEATASLGEARAERLPSLRPYVLDWTDGVDEGAHIGEMSLVESISWQCLSNLIPEIDTLDLMSRSPGLSP